MPALLVIGHSACCARCRYGGSPRPVLIGVPTGRDVEPAVEFAFAEAAARGAPVWELQVWPRQDDGDPAGVHPGRRDRARRQDKADRKLVDAMGGWAEKYPGVPVARTVRHCVDAPLALLAAARSAQLAVVASTYPRAGEYDHPLGSVRHLLVHRGACPVALVPVG